MTPGATRKILLHEYGHHIDWTYPVPGAPEPNGTPGWWALRQTALVPRRIADAATEGCDLVTALTAFGSASQRTLERAGLRVAYMRTVWRLGDS